MTTCVKDKKGCIDMKVHKARDNKKLVELVVPMSYGLFEPIDCFLNLQTYDEKSKLTKPKGCAI